MISIKAPKEIGNKIDEVDVAWGDLAEAKTFAGMTLEQFRQRVQPSLDARRSIRNLRDAQISALTLRSVSDRESTQAIALVVNAIKGDTTEGEDSALYKACGYVRRT